MLAITLQVISSQSNVSIYEKGVKIVKLDVNALDLASRDG